MLGPGSSGRAHRLTAHHTYGAVTDWCDEVGRQPVAPDRRRPLEGIHYPWRPTVRLSARPSICWSAVY